MRLLASVWLFKLSFIISKHLLLENLQHKQTQEKLKKEIRDSIHLIAGQFDYVEHHVLSHRLTGCDLKFQKSSKCLCIICLYSYTNLMYFLIIGHLSIEFLSSIGAEKPRVGSIAAHGWLNNTRDSTPAHWLIVPIDFSVLFSLLPWWKQWDNWA